MKRHILKAKLQAKHITKSSNGSAKKRARLSLALALKSIELIVKQKMIPNTKISETILEFGKSLILELPSEHSKEEFEAVITIVITTWNAVVMDAWGKMNTYESELLSAMQAAPKEVQIEIKRLIKRKRNKFGSDPRAVGNHWIREKDGGLVFGCEARLNVENAPAPDTKH